ncbi:hypothetical protein QE394_001786 [Arthrobacter sp. SORGH_AS 212]|uniref:SpvB/TcaC N-terminal domain-containing protein n=1 Tax=Pseudarthrobacter sp. SORGH_AS 212 TaxID=3041777 RepID=UPI00278673EC|nr:hypothetical protein [Arthrobacter sp. SORGH_AS_0212]
MLPQAPRIELPKGGGAIRSLGEKFAANPVTGTGSLSLPIAASPGRAEFGPALPLTYDSATGNGPFGFGWSLSLPSITRKTDTGLPRYRDDTDSDDFLLSGTEDLVPAMVQAADGTWAPPKLPLRTVDGRRYRIRRYRPRIEGLFARIERWTNIGDPSDVFWRTISKDNVTTWYGRTPESRIADPLDASRIFSWAICETHDDKGNVIVYDFIAEDSERIFEGPGGGLIAKAHERNRSDVSRSAQRYLKRVRYGNSRPYYPALDVADPWPEPPGARALDGSDFWHFELVLDYGDHDEAAPVPAPTRVWPCRSDPFSRYSAGFEIRTYRICQRALMFHHFPAEPGVGRECLVSSTDFTYSDEVDPAAAQNAVYTFLTAVTHTGYRRNGGDYEARSMPPVELRYSEVEVESTVRRVERTSHKGVPVTLADLAHRWVDLHGEGIPGLLTEQAGAWFYERNVSPVTGAGGEEAGIARFAAAETVAHVPTATLSRGGEFLDLAGDGRLDVVTWGGATLGLFEHDADEGWEPFRAFAAPLVRDLRDPNLRFVDLDGDGLADVLISEDDAYVWHVSLGEAGFGRGERLIKALDEERGPRVVFADPSESIHLADISGDGLSDIVRIRNGEVSYWPNLGYGRFGAKVTMDGPPWFDELDIFDPARLRLADIDGSGTTDILYLHGDGVMMYPNQSGNGWSAPQRLAVQPETADLGGVVLVDLLGNGTACLVWTSSSPGDSERPTCYVSLAGEQKPHLLVSLMNNLGAEVHVTYAPSTRFYLQDKAVGRPWLCNLPFPVHVVERIETVDRVSRTRFVSRFSYHHGCFDGEEREFRGFGMVEQFDTEAFEDHVAGVARMDGAQETTPELYQPPVTTRTWYHTGSIDEERLTTQGYRAEYYRGEQHLPAPKTASSRDAGEARESMRALKGVVLRQETYSHDDSSVQEHPYAVMESTYEVRRLQPRSGQRHAVFLTVPRESVSLAYERNAADPRISHSLALDLDEYGNPRSTCMVAYGRKQADPDLPGEVTAAQGHPCIVWAETEYTDDIDADASPDAYRLRVPFDSRSHEITGLQPETERFTIEQLADDIAAAADIDYEIVADGATIQRRLLSHKRATFLDDELNPLPLGEGGSLGLVHEWLDLRLTPGVLAAQYAGQVADAELTAAGYVRSPGHAGWWAPSGTPVYPPNARDAFYVPVGTREPLGIETIATYDAYHLLIEAVSVTQAAWNVVTAANDYRVLAPVLITDANGNRSAVEHDELGMVVKSAVMGKSGSGDGDSLADPTTRSEYELFNWRDHGKPNFARTLTRERHGTADTRWQETYSYSAGAGGVVLVKTRAHPGRALRVEADGSAVEVDADPRWIGNGRVVTDNKGNVVKQYEPYFSTTSEYEDESAVRELGVTAITYYDPLGRSIRTEFPSGTFTKVEFTPWLTRLFDVNDTVTESRWYMDRGSPDPVAEPEPANDPERRSAWLAAKHAGTPAVAHSDSLGRTIYVVSDYGGGKAAAARTEIDLAGRFSRDLRPGAA